MPIRLRPMTTIGKLRRFLAGGTAALAVLGASEACATISNVNLDTNGQNGGGTGHNPVSERWRCLFSR